MPARLRRFLPTPVTVMGSSSLQVDSIGDDAGQNLRSAMHQRQYGIYGESAHPVQGCYRREPFPNWILAANLKWLTGVPSGIRFHELVAHLQLLKASMAVNFFYRIGLFLSLWGLCIRLISSRWPPGSGKMSPLYIRTFGGLRTPDQQEDSAERSSRSGHAGQPTAAIKSRSCSVFRLNRRLNRYAISAR
jgi:hypothetical protein